MLDGSFHCVNEDKELDGIPRCYRSGWNHSLIFDFRCGTPLFAFAPMCSQETDADFREENGAIFYTLSHREEIPAGEVRELIFYWGLGFEEVAAATSAKEMLRRGWDWEYRRTVSWLEKRTRQMPTAKLTDIYNTNLLFCIFILHRHNAGYRGAGLCHQPGHPLLRQRRLLGPGRPSLVLPCYLGCRPGSGRADSPLCLWPSAAKPRYPLSIH